MLKTGWALTTVPLIRMLYSIKTSEEIGARHIPAKTLAQLDEVDHGFVCNYRLTLDSIGFFWAWDEEIKIISPLELLAYGT